jgi:hypothetical protein
MANSGFASLLNEEDRFTVQRTKKEAILNKEVRFTVQRAK